MESKACTKCQENKPLDEFPRQRASKDGRNAWCRECYRRWHRARYTPKTGGDDAPRNCELCGASYTPKQRNGTQKFCSAACKQKAGYWARNPRQQRICPTCGVDISHMRRNAQYCSAICAQRARVADGRITPELRRMRRLLADYGITAEQYEAMLAAQGDGCAICGDDGSTSRGGLLHVDHCHRSGAVRGLLCESCNLALGKFKDDSALLRRAAEYLEAAASN